MATELDGDLQRASESWDRLFRQLSARPRRRILLAMMRVPADDAIRLPEGAFERDRIQDAERLAIELRHHHLPSLETAEYVTWSDAPLSVRRGECFDEPASVLSAVLSARMDLPGTLWNESIERIVAP